MLIAEIFSSVQGEGELVGMPSVFVRASGCNLRCAWCDTPYASWEPEGRNLSLDEIVSAVTAERGPRHVVLTGGEPMIAPGMRELAARLRELRYHITVETAATVAPEGIACDLASLSPKLLNSAPDAVKHPGWRRRHEAARWQPAVVRAWLDGGYHCQFKFVVADPADLEEIEGMLRAIDRPIPPSQVLLMPEGTSLEVLRQRAQWLVGACQARGYRYAHRLHIELFGNRRGT